MRYRSLVRSSEPTVYPVTLSEAKLHLRIDNLDDDSLITGLIASATRWCEDYCDRTFVQTQWTMRLDSFYGPVGSPVQFGLRADGNNIEGRQGTVPNLDIELPRPPMMQSGTATAVTITYTPSAGASAATLDAAEYRVDRQATPGVCRPLYGKTWPSHLVDQNSTTVTWWAGYSADGSSVPPPVKSAVLMLVSHLWSNRDAAAESTLSEVPMTINPTSGSPGPRLDGTAGAGGAHRAGQGPRVGGPAPAAPAESPVHRDVVDLSPAARGMVASDGEEVVTAERLAAIRQQVLEGAYGQLETIEALARRIRQSGDLG